MQELYFVAIIAEEPVLSAAENFKQELHERFGTKSALKSPAHITLVPPFEFNPANENQLAETLRQVAANEKSIHIRLNGFDVFPPQVIFIRVSYNAELISLQGKIKKSFAEIPGIKLKSDKLPFHPHITIGNRDWKAGDFEIAGNDYCNKNFEADFMAGKIVLLRLVHGKWIGAAEGFFS